MKQEGTKNTLAIDATLMIMLTLDERMNLSPAAAELMSDVIQAGIEAALIMKQAVMLKPKEN